MLAVLLAYSEGNVHPAERQLLVGLNAVSSSSSQVQGQSRDLVNLVMKQALRMQLTCIMDAKLSIRMQLEDAQLLHR